MKLNYIRQRNIKQQQIGQQKGETIIEVVIATLVFAVGILGNLGLQSASVQSNTSSLHQTKAILAVNDIAERIRANRTAALLGAYDDYTSTHPPENPGCSDTPCNGTNIANYHLHDWSQHFSNVYDDTRFLALLPDGAATIDYNTGTSEYTITISWIEQAYAETHTGTQKADRRRNHSIVIAI